MPRCAPNCGCNGACQEKIVFFGCVCCRQEIETIVDLRFVSDVRYNHHDSCESLYNICFTCLRDNFDYSPLSQTSPSIVCSEERNVMEKEEEEKEEEVVDLEVPETQDFVLTPPPLKRAKFASLRASAIRKRLL